jgi:hypothetical protein
VKSAKNALKQSEKFGGDLVSMAGKKFKLFVRDNGRLRGVYFTKSSTGFVFGRVRGAKHVTLLLDGERTQSAHVTVQRVQGAERHPFRVENPDPGIEWLFGQGLRSCFDRPFRGKFVWHIPNETMVQMVVRQIETQLKQENRVFILDFEDSDLEKQFQKLRNPDFSNLADALMLSSMQGNWIKVYDKKPFLVNKKKLNRLFRQSEFGKLMKTAFGRTQNS